MWIQDLAKGCVAIPSYAGVCGILGKSRTYRGVGGGWGQLAVPFRIIHQVKLLTYSHVK